MTAPSPANAVAGRAPAETAREAWPPPTGALPRLRDMARSLALSAAALRPPRHSSFLRCLYGHTVFPDQRDKLRRLVADLRDIGEFIDTATLFDMTRDRRPPSGRYFHLSFDDGYANVFENGAPVLAELKVPAIIFVIADLVAGAHPEIPNPPAYRPRMRVMSWDMVRQAKSLGVDIGSHTRRHPRLSAISGDKTRLFEEIAVSKRLVERVTGEPCRAFAWPYGTMADIDADGFAMIAAAGYELCFGATRGRVEPGADPLRLPRHQIELHWPDAHARLWASGYGENSART